MALEIRLRTTRTLKVTELKVDPQASEHLARLYQSPEYEALLDVMERGCIELETAHLNTSVGSPEEILGGHSLCKGVWKFFTYIQKQVHHAYVTRDTGEVKPAEPSLNDLIQGVEPYEEQHGNEEVG